MPRLKGDPSKLPRIQPSNRSMSENQTGNWRSLRPDIDRDACTNCLLCWKFCPEACITIDDNQLNVDMRYCKGCGICAQECPQKCVKMSEEKST